MTAAAPPSAETVWLRIGYTLEITATLSCGLASATAIAARNPAPPPPTTSTSQLKRSMTLAALSFNIRDPGYLIELLSDAYERGAPRVLLTADGSKKPGACVGHRGDGHCRRGRAVREPEPGPSGAPRDRTVHIREVAEVWAGRGALSTRFARPRRALRS